MPFALPCAFEKWARLLAAAGLALSAVCAVLPASALAQAAPASTVRIVLESPLKLLDPVFTNSYSTRDHGYLVYDTLFAMDSQGRPQPQMVDRWTETPDGLGYRFTLRAGLKFHDGSEVTAEDVVASVRRWSERDPLGARLLQAATRFEAVDAKTFVLELGKPYGLVLESLAKPGAPVPFIMPRRLAATPAAQPVAEIVGSGPYRFAAAEHQAGIKAVYLKSASYVPRSEPADNFAGGKHAIAERLEIVNIVDPQTALNALRKGEIDYIANVSSDLVDQLAQDRKLTVLPLKTATSMFTLRMNWAQPPFNNAKVRQAALAALSQADYLQAQIGDARLYSVCGAVLGCGSPYAAQDGAVQTRQPDLARARQLLKASGYQGEKVVVLHSADTPILSALAPVTAKALQDIGMRVELQSMDFATLLARRTKQEPTGQGGWSIFQSNMTSLDLANPLANPNLDSTGTLYPGWTREPALEALREQFAAERSFAQRVKIAQAIQARAMDQVLYVPLGQNVAIRAYGPRLAQIVQAQLPLFWTAAPGRQAAP